MVEPESGESPGIKFGRFVFHAETATLLKSGREIRVQAQPLALLGILASRPGILVSREDLHRLLWPDIAFLDFDTALNSTVKKLRQALEDDASSPSFIRTVPRKGYIFIATAHPVALRFSPSQDETQPVAPAPAQDPAPPIIVSKDAESVREPFDAPVLVPRPPTATFISPRQSLLLASILLLLAAIFAGFRLFPWSRSPVVLNGVRYTSNSAENSLVDCAISPDGKFLAYVDRHHVRVVTVSDFSETVLNNVDGLHVSRLSWFPDSANLLVAGSEGAGNTHSLWRASILGNQPPVQIFVGAADGRVSPNGKYYAVIVGERDEIVLAEPDRPGTYSLSHRPDITDVLWSPDSARVFYSYKERGSNFVESVSPRGGKPELLREIPSLESAVILAPNSFLYSVNVWPGTEIHQLTFDRTSGQESEAPALLQRIEAVALNHFSASSDGTKVAYLQGESLAEIWTGDLLDGNMRLENERRLTLQDFDAYPHGWTHDSRSVLFESARFSKKWSIYKQDPSDPEAQPLLPNSPPAIRAVGAPGGGAVLFEALHPADAGVPEAEKIMRLPADRRAPFELYSFRNTGSFRCPYTSGHPCVIAEESRGGLMFSYLDPVRGTTTRWKNHLPDLQAIDWDLSPDGASVAILSRGGNDNHILLLRDNGAFGEFIASNTSSLRSLNWWANGEGFFCSRESRNTISMLSISRDRKITVLDKDLGDGPSWAVPSPDGHRLAFVSHMKHYNVWLAARRP